MAVVEGKAVQQDSWDAFDAALAAAIGMPTGSGVGVTDDAVEAARRDCTSALAQLLDSLRRLPDGMLIDCCANYEQQLASERLLAVARKAGTTGDVGVDRRRARNTMSNARNQHCSGRSVNQEARRAAAVAANERLGEHLSNGSIAPESIDALNKAADEQTGEIPPQLIDAVRGLAPDQAGRLVADHLEEQVDPTDLERQYQRQRQARTAYQYEVAASGGRPAMSGIAMEGPPAEVAGLWAQVEAWANAAYQADGGRSLPATQHTSLANRRFDGLVAAIGGDAGGASATGGGAARPTVVVTVDADSLFGSPDEPVVATQLGVGPIPESLFEQYAASGSTTAVLRRFDGSPLWFGRTRTGSSDAQFVALAVRDRGCVLCGARLDRCHAHHVMPWTAPGRGRTDVDQMALLCQRCHRDLHHRNHTLEFETGADGKRVWSTRPATPEETPAPRPVRLIQRE